MSLSNADVAKVALLARLRLSPDELETFTGQLNSIVDYVASSRSWTRPASSRWPTASSCATSSATMSAARHSSASRRWPTPPAERRRLPGSRRSGVNGFDEQSNPRRPHRFWAAYHARARPRRKRSFARFWIGVKRRGGSMCSCISIPSRVLAQARAIDARRRGGEMLGRSPGYRWRSRTCSASRRSRRAAAAGCCGTSALPTTPL